MDSPAETRSATIAADSASDAKSEDECRIERATWFGIVGVLVVTGALPPWLTLPYGVTPLATGCILILSGFLQYRRGYRVGYTTWVAGTLLLATAGYNFVNRPDLDLTLIAIVAAIFVVGAGVFTRET